MIIRVTYKNIRNLKSLLKYTSEPLRFYKTKCLELVTLVKPQTSPCNRNFYRAYRMYTNYTKQYTQFYLRVFSIR
jgi:hypothetical protein